MIAFVTLYVVSVWDVETFQSGMFPILTRETRRVEDGEEEGGVLPPPPFFCCCSAHRIANGTRLNGVLKPIIFFFFLTCKSRAILESK